jgi:hypothetical protein
MDSARRGLALDLTRSQLRERLFLATRKRGRQKHQTGIVGRFLAKAGVPGYQSDGDWW